MSFFLLTNHYIIGTPCGSAEDTMEIKQISFVPEIPVRGQFLNVTASGTLKETVDVGSKVNLAVKWGFVRVPVPAVDICQEFDAPESPFKCPVQPGDFAVDQGFLLPDNIPDGKFDVTVRLKDHMNRQITCVKVMLSFDKQPKFEHEE